MTFELPPIIALGEEERKLFADLDARTKALNNKQAAVREFLQTVVQSGEARLTELQGEAQRLNADGKALWSRIAREHKLDLRRVAYDLSRDGSTLVPISMKVDVDD